MGVCEHNMAYQNTQLPTLTTLATRSGFTAASTVRASASSSFTKRQVQTL